jgi:hypothetical protein
MLLRIVVLCFGLLILLSGLGIWRNVFFYPKIWRERITVDGGVCGECAVYVSHGHFNGGVLVRRTEQGSEFYSVAFPNADLDVPKGGVWKCDAGAFSFVPGLAFHHVHQRCASWGMANAQKDVAMNPRLLAFTADDGKRIRAEW